MRRQDQTRAVTPPERVVRIVAAHQVRLLLVQGASFHETGGLPTESSGAPPFPGAF